MLRVKAFNSLKIVLLQHVSNICNRFHKEKLYNSSVGKTILMVIDGIRLDFVMAGLMPYTSAVMGNGREEGCQLTARVAAPTVTLPRVKVRYLKSSVFSLIKGAALLFFF